jgi:acetylornithine deacetylase/succinyl-diaminopimelate desuccinylase-like protein
LGRVKKKQVRKDKQLRLDERRNLDNDRGMSDELIQLCSDLVRLASVNPQSEDRDDWPYGEKRVGDFVFDWLDKQGLKPQRQPVRAGRENIFALAAGRDQSKTLLLCAHLDTVDVKGMTVEPFEPVVREDKIFGRGACDDKGPLATIMMAFRDRVRRGVELPCNLALLATCGEEFSLEGARYFAEHLLCPVTAAVIAEPTELNVITSHKGVVRIRLTAHGRSAHSSTPQRGLNAIYIMTETAGHVRRFGESLSQRQAHPQLGHETLSVTMIQGGQQINVIPDRCRAEIDWRILPGRQPETCRDELAAMLRSQMREPVEIEMLGYYEPMHTEIGHPVVEALLDASLEVTGRRITEAVPYATDAGAMTRLNIPTPIFGPGSAAQAHTPDEYIMINQLETGLAVYERFLRGRWDL